MPHHITNLLSSHRVGIIRAEHCDYKVPTKCLASESQHSCRKIMQTRSIFDSFSPSQSIAQNYLQSCRLESSYSLQSLTILSSTTFQIHTTPPCISFFASNKWSGEGLATQTLGIDSSRRGRLPGWAWYSPLTTRYCHGLQSTISSIYEEI